MLKKTYILVYPLPFGGSCALLVLLFGLGFLLELGGRDMVLSNFCFSTSTKEKQFKQNYQNTCGHILDMTLYF